MKCYLAILFLCAHACQAAVVPGPINAIEYGNVEENEISDEHDSVYGLYPPKASAKDYYDSKTSYPNKGVPSSGEYVIDTVNKVLKLNTEEGSRETKLKPVEEMEIKKLSAAFAKIFESSKLENYDWGSPNQTEPSVTNAPTETSTDDWRKLSPIITVSKTGVSIAFGNETEANTESTTEEDVEDPERASLWDTISKSVDKILIDELDRRLNTTSGELPTEKPPAEEPSSLVKFVSSVWNVMKASLDYVGALFSNLVFGNSSADKPSNVEDVPATTEPEEEDVTVPPTTTVAVFAYEEPTRYKRLPAEEFETRRRDIDSLFYGYGIV